MSIRGKVFRGVMTLENIGGKGKFFNEKRKEQIPIILRYEEGGIKSGILVSCDTEDFDLVITALRKLQGITNGQNLIDRIFGENSYVVKPTTGLILPGNGGIHGS